MPSPHLSTTFQRSTCLCRHPLLHLLLPHLLQPLSALGWQWTTNPFLNPCYNQGRDSGDGWPDRCLATKGCVQHSVLTSGDKGTCIPDLDNWGACYGYAAVICYNDPSFECQNDVEVPGCISTCGSKATSLIVCALEDIRHCGGHAYLQPSDDNIGRDLSITLCTMCEHGSDTATPTTPTFCRAAPNQASRGRCAAARRAPPVSRRWALRRISPTRSVRVGTASMGTTATR